MAAVDFHYDTMGRLASLARTANWDPSTTINTSYTLDLLDRVTGITHSKVAGEVATTLSAFTYGYDANGRVVASTGPEGSLSFALGPLVINLVPKTLNEETACFFTLLTTGDKSGKQADPGY